MQSASIRYGRRAPEMEKDSEDASGNVACMKTTSLSHCHNPIITHTINPTPASPALTHTPLLLLLTPARPRRASHPPLRRTPPEDRRSGAPNPTILFHLPWPRSFPGQGPDLLPRGPVQRMPAPTPGQWTADRHPRAGDCGARGDRQDRIGSAVLLSRSEREWLGGWLCVRGMWPLLLGPG